MPQKLTVLLVSGKCRSQLKTRQFNNFSYASVTCYFRKGVFEISASHRLCNVRINGSHYRLKHPDGRITTIPVHKNQDLPKGLLRKIIREDLELEIVTFIELLNK